MSSRARADGGAEPHAPLSRSLDARALERLVEGARASYSDELLVVRNRELVGHWHFTKERGPIETMSITKSILSLAVGSLVDRGKLRLEQPVSELFPEWRASGQRGITLKHLLTHSSGLDEGESTRDIYAQADFVKLTLRTQLIHEPGTHYQYSNRGANLVSGVIAKASGMRTDRYVRAALFEPLGIRKYSWTLDRSGQAMGLAGLQMLPRDLARLGELVAADGEWEGRRLVSADWLRRSMELGPVQPPNKRLGLFWWLVPESTRIIIDDATVTRWREAGIDETFVAKVAPLMGRQFDSVPSFVQALRDLFGDPALTEWNENTWKRGVPDAHFEFGPVIGLYAVGTLGQYLVILPRDRLVAVRMRRTPQNRAEREDASRTYPDFVERVRALVSEGHTEDFSSP